MRFIRDANAGVNSHTSSQFALDNLNKWLDSDEAKQIADKYCTDPNEPPSAAVQEFMKQLTPRPSTPEVWPLEYAQAEAASAAGDLDTLKKIFEAWQGNPRGYGAFAPCLAYVLQGGKNTLAITTYLLDFGVEPEACHFHCAMQHRDFPVMDLYLRHGFDINDYESPFDPTALAAALDDDEMTRWLLERGADPNAEKIRRPNTSLSDRMGETALSKAMWNTPFERIRLLFDYGGPKSIHCGSLLYYALGRGLPDRLEVLEFLLRKGADLTRYLHHDRPEAARQDEWIGGRGTPLHSAARAGMIDAVKLFIAWGADFSMPDSQGVLPIDKARARKALMDKGFSDIKAYPGEDADAVVAYLTALSERKHPSLAPSTKGLERL
ncbi:MAG: hypothetical protein Q9168_004536 [Polycauliona sp. 1 TL-2023]